MFFLQFQAIGVQNMGFVCIRMDPWLFEDGYTELPFAASGVEDGLVILVCVQHEPKTDKTADILKMNYRSRNSTAFLCANICSIYPLSFSQPEK